MSTHHIHIHLAFEDIPLANFEVQKSMEGMGVRAQQDTVKFFSEGPPYLGPLYITKFLEWKKHLTSALSDIPSEVRTLNYIPMSKGSGWLVVRR